MKRMMILAITSWAHTVIQLWSTLLPCLTLLTALGVEMIHIPA